MQPSLVALGVLTVGTLQSLLSTAHPLPALARTSNPYNGAPEAAIQWSSSDLAGRVPGNSTLSVQSASGRLRDGAAVDETVVERALLLSSVIEELRPPGSVDLLERYVHGTARATTCYDPESIVTI
ncbi:hypothetical protein PHLGIDRAFT_13629 [Phlebiopsis gigantea 11061_1 CR5-6]|uniref:Uncharacterized protein n=1 Tax=Phlebiopsis gigantea (strain 11061_1 CR5-6) TaxID=745531 RepID=A0A0C3NNX4_PHLG1|nr:hypothetical protein PHLGIDRAFT_13629 [Phlebiopsis gigantea 11061_1 CR5-6]